MRNFSSGYTTWKPGDGCRIVRAGGGGLAENTGVCAEMHELGAATELFEVVEKNASENGLKKVSKVSVRVGEASGIEMDFLKHSFLEHIFPGSIAEGAELEIVEEKVKVICKDCGVELNADGIELSGSLMKCPECGGDRLEVSGGKDIYLDSIEGEK